MDDKLFLSPILNIFLLNVKERERERGDYEMFITLVLKVLK